MPKSPAAIRAVYERNLTDPVTGIDWRSNTAVAAEEIELPGLICPAGCGLMAGGIYAFRASGRWGEASTANDLTFRVYYKPDGAAAVQLFGFVCEDLLADDMQLRLELDLIPHDHVDKASGAQVRMGAHFRLFADGLPIGGSLEIVTTTMQTGTVGGTETIVNGDNMRLYQAAKLFNNGASGSTLLETPGRIYVTFEKVETSTLVEFYNAAWIPFTHDRAEV